MFPETEDHQRHFITVLWLRQPATLTPILIRESGSRDILVLWGCIKNTSIKINLLLYPHSLPRLSSLCARGSPFICPFGWCLTLTGPAAPTKSGYLAAGLFKMVLPRSTGPRFITKKDGTDTASSGVCDRRSLVTAVTVPCILVSPSRHI